MSQNECFLQQHAVVRETSKHTHPPHPPKKRQQTFVLRTQKSRPQKVGKKAAKKVEKKAARKVGKKFIRSGTCLAAVLKPV